LRWDEVNDKLDPGDFTMEVVLERIQRSGDIFAPVLKGRQSIGDALKRIR
jgi:DNA primase